MKVRLGFVANSSSSDYIADAYYEKNKDYWCKECNNSLDFCECWCDNCGERMEECRCLKPTAVKEKKIEEKGQLEFPFAGIDKEALDEIQKWIRK